MMMIPGKCWAITDHFFAPNFSTRSTTLRSSSSVQGPNNDNDDGDNDDDNDDNDDTFSKIGIQNLRPSMEALDFSLTIQMFGNLFPIFTYNDDNDDSDDGDNDDDKWWW